MEIVFGEYQIEIFDDSQYNLNSTNNKFSYKTEIFDTSTNDCCYLSKCGIRVLKNRQLYNSAIVLGKGSPTKVNKDCFVLHGDKLYLVVGSALFSVNLPDLTVSWIAHGDESCCFAIYTFLDNFIVHGELSISCFDFSGNLLWRFYGKDIFVNRDGKDEFKIVNETVELVDWDGNHYTLNKNGKMIE